MKTFNGLATGSIKTINGLAIASVKTVNGFATAETRYWVGGTGNTNDTAHWSLTSGGAGGASVPTATENAVWDSNSGGGTVTFNATFNCKDFDSTSYTGTLAGGSARNARGSYILGTGVTVSMTGTTTLSATTSGHTVNTNGKTLAHSITFNGVGGGWSSSNITTSLNITVSNGTPDFTGKTLTCAIWSITNGTPILTGSTINNTGNFTGGSKTYNDVNRTLASTTTAAVTGSNTFNDYTLTNTSSYAGETFAAGTTNTISGEYSAVALNASAARLFVRSATAGSSATLALNNTATVENVDYMDMVVSGSAAPLTSTLLGDCGRCSGITFATPITAYWVHPVTASQNPPVDLNWFTAPGGATPARSPLPQDSMVFDANSFGTTGLTVVFGASGPQYRYGAMDWTGATNSPTANFVNSALFFGSITFISGMTISGTGPVVMSGDKDMEITTAGKTITFSLSVNCPEGSVTLLDDYISNAGISLTAGTLDANDFDVTMGSGFNVSGAITRVLNMGSGTWTMTGTNIAWNITATGLTVNAGTSTIKYTNNSSTVKEFSGAGLTYYTVWNATAGSGAFIYTGNNTYNTIKSDAGRTNQFVGGSTHTVETLDINGTSGNRTVLSRSSGSGQYNIVLSDPTPVVLDYVTIFNANFSGATVTATNSLDGGGNTGITFI